MIPTDDDGVRPDVPPVVWHPDGAASSRVGEFLGWLERERGLSFDSYDDLWRWSADALEDFWDAVWQFFGVLASAGYSSVLSSRDMPGARWFEGARLNYAEAVLARAPRDRPALIAVAEGRPPREISLTELRGQVGALAAGLRDLGVGPGDRVAAYLPNIPEAVVALLATASIGAVWTSCAPDFGLRSVVERLGQVEPTVLIAVDGYRWGGREHDRRDVLAQLRDAMTSVRAVIVVQSLHPDDPLPDPRVVSYAGLVDRPQEPAFSQVEFSAPLWVLFSSGTTGLPKGIVHSHGGIVVEHLKALGLCLDLRGGRHLLLPQLHQLDGVELPRRRPAARQHRRALRRQPRAPLPRCPLAGGGRDRRERARHGLRLRGRLREGRRRGAAGSAPSCARWSRPAPPAPGRVAMARRPGGPAGPDRLHLRGTDVCTAFFGGSPLLPVWQGEISGRWLGVAAAAYDPDGQPVVARVGEFVVTAPMPSMPVGFWQDPDMARYRSAYFDTYDGIWRQGDWLTVTERGSVVVSGRSDATLNRGGVRMGSAEIYGVVESMPEIADSLVVGIERPDGGYSMDLFVVPAAGTVLDDDLRERIGQALREHLSPRHVPDRILAAPGVPRTLTGKKLEIPVKRLLLGATVDDDAASAGAVDRPELLDWFADANPIPRPSER